MNPRLLVRLVALATLVGCTAANDGLDSSSPIKEGARKAKPAGADGATDDDPLVDDESGPATSGPRAPVRTAPAPLPVPDGFYPRVIQRANGKIVASVVRFLPGSGRMGATVFESTDEGQSFAEVGAIDDPINQGGLCCGTLYELPKAVGAMAAGTLLWSASSGGDTPDAPMTIPVWKSEDDGRTWTFVSRIATGSKPRRNGGLWEPEFALLDDGALSVHWSDETDSRHSQKLVMARSTDGVTWRDQHDTIALPTFGHRPGMPNIRRAAAPGSPFVMSYEICGVTGDSCTAFLRFSNDGWNWGDARNVGIRITTVDGLHFRHAPTLAWSAAPGASGRFFVVGQMVYGVSGAVNAPVNGTVIFGSSEGAAHGWYPIPSPVPVPEAFDNFCPNYSSSLLPLENGRVGLFLASKWDGNLCRTYFARGPLVETTDTSELADGATYRLRSAHSGLCLAGATQEPCNEGPAQRVTVQRNADGLAFRGATWKPRTIGLGYYELKRTDTGRCLDVSGGAIHAGAPVGEWDCNDLAPQIWKLEPR